MIRPVIISTALIALLPAPSGSAWSPALIAAQQSAGQVTAADAAPFVGDWTLTLEGQNGPAAFELAVTVEKDKVVGEITHPGAPARPITDVSKTDQSLVLSYSFDYEGNAVDAVVRMTPADEGKTNAEISFAGGAYVMSGTAAKKEKAKQP